MVDAWEELAAWSAQRTQCTEDVAQIKNLCAHDHSQFKHVIECRECYGKVLDRMRNLYLGPQNEDRPQWLAGREEFCKELDALFTAAGDYRASIQDIDALVASERRKWYLSSVGNPISIRKGLDDILKRGHIATVPQILPDNIDSLIEETRAAFVGSGALKRLAGAEGTNDGLHRLMAANTLEEKVQAYKEVLFQDVDGSDALTQKYLKQIDQGSTMDDVNSQIILDHRLSKEARASLEDHKRKIEEFRRAKAALELQTSKKAGGRKDKIAVSEEFVVQPPCPVCLAKLDGLNETPVCEMCLILAFNGVRSERTVYCSDACYNNPETGRNAHLEAAHDICAAPQGSCIQEADPKFEYDEVHDEHAFCNECTKDLKRECFFCCMSCADLNFRRHREEVHVPERRKRGQEVDRDSDGLAFEGLDKSNYHARDIRSYFTLQSDLSCELKENSGMVLGAMGQD